MIRKIFTTLILTIIINVGYSQSPEEDFIKNFYRDYITTCEGKPPTELFELRKKYCSSKLLNQINSKSLDFDPFFDAQDCFKEWIDSMNIKPIPNTHLKIEISLSPNSKPIIITLIQLKTGFLIDAISTL